MQRASFPLDRCGWSRCHEIGDKGTTGYARRPATLPPAGERAVADPRSLDCSHRMQPQVDEHTRRSRDTNSHAHQRASLIGPSLAVPILDGQLALGTWQQAVLIHFDDRPRSRTVVVQVVS